MTLPADARCATHPEQPAVATCWRCGVFLCVDDLRIVEGHYFCDDCSTRPEVDYLGAFQQRYQGRRDGLAWFWGVAGVGFGATAVLRGATAGSEVAVALWACAVTSLLHFLGIKRTRMWMVVTVVALCLLLLQLGRTGWFVSALVGVPLLSMAASTWGSVRNRLFFELPVHPLELKREWDDTANNAAARNGLSLAILGLVVPGIALAGLALGIVGLRQVDPHGHPPVGKRRQAMAAIVLGGIASALWTSLGVMWLLGWRL